MSQWVLTEVGEVLPTQTLRTFLTPAEKSSPSEILKQENMDKYIRTSDTETQRMYPVIGLGANKEDLGIPSNTKMRTHLNCHHPSSILCMRTKMARRLTKCQKWTASQTLILTF